MAQGARVLLGWTLSQSFYVVLGMGETQDLMLLTVRFLVSEIDDCN